MKGFLGTLAVILAVAVLAFLAARALWRERKSGGGCSGDCASCGGCSSCGGRRPQSPQK